MIACDGSLTETSKLKRAHKFWLTSCLSIVEYKCPVLVWLHIPHHVQIMEREKLRYLNKNDDDMTGVTIKDVVRVTKRSSP